MNKFHAALIAALFSSSFIAPAALAQASCPPRNASVPAGANTTNPSAPFFIDTSGMNLNTQPPTRNPANPNYPPATALAEGKLPSTSADGNFIIGPAHPAAPETVAQNGVPKGTVYSFTMSSKDSVIYNPGMVREDPQNCLNASISSAPTAAGDLSNLIVTTSHAGTWTRTVDVYVPAGYVRGTEAPFIVVSHGAQIIFGDASKGGPFEDGFNQ